MKKKLWIGFIVLVLIAGVMAFGVRVSSNNSIATADNFDTNHTIEVSGESAIEVAPDIAYINFGISKQEKTAEKAMNELSKIADRVITVLKNFGIKEINIKTTGINLYPVYQWDKETKKNVLIGYSASESFKVLTKLKDTGRVISLITENGVNKIYGIYFDYSKKGSLKKDAISKAVEDAREKAEASLTGTNYKIVGIKTISIQSGNITPVVRQSLDKSNESGEVNIPVEGGSITVRATVNVVFIFD